MKDTPELQFNSASVKVMRSFDYCHFEIVLSGPAETVESVDELRKAAARLADKAVEQYKTAKENTERRLSDISIRARIVREAFKVEKLQEIDRTPKDKAILKALADDAFARRPRYNYEDNWGEDQYDDQGLDEEVPF